MTRPESSPIYLVHRGAASPRGDAEHTVVVLRGEYDVANRSDLEAALERASELDDADVLVDLSEVTFMDASTVGAILSGERLLHTLARSLELRAPSLSAIFVLELCGLSRLIRPSVLSAAPGCELPDSTLSLVGDHRAS